MHVQCARVHRHAGARSCACTAAASLSLELHVHAAAHASAARARRPIAFSARSIDGTGAGPAGRGGRAYCRQLRVGVFNEVQSVARARAKSIDASISMIMIMIAIARARARFMCARSQALATIDRDSDLKKLRTRFRDGARTVRAHDDGVACAYTCMYFHGLQNLVTWVSMLVCLQELPATRACMRLLSAECRCQTCTRVPAHRATAQVRRRAVG